MKIPALALTLFALCSTSLWAVEPSELPELRGILSVGGKKEFNLSNQTGAQSSWVSLGQDYSGWKLESFDAKSEQLVLSKNGATVQVSLSNSQFKDVATKKGTQATLADAEDVMRRMNMDAMMDKMMAQQKKMGAQMAKQMGGKMGMDPADAGDFEVFQNKVMEAMFPQETIDAMKKDMTRIYSEVFTKEQLKGLSDFYGTEVGQALNEKTPDIQQKMSESIMPRMQQNMMKLQQLGREFGEQMKAKKAARAAEGTGAAAPAPSSLPAPTAPAPKPAPTGT